MDFRSHGSNCPDSSIATHGFRPPTNVVVVVVVDSISRRAYHDKRHFEAACGDAIQGPIGL
eukprot:scaffold411158_cov24-Attheya_sp.AAC.1